MVMSGFLFPSTIGMYTPRLVALTGGNDLLYSVPAGKSMTTVVNFMSVVSEQVNGFASNLSASAANYLVYCVPVGQSVGPNYFIKSVVVSSAGGNTTMTLPTLPSEASIYVVSDNVLAGQIVRLTVLEE